MNPKNTQIRINKNDDITIRGLVIEDVFDFVYLKATINKSGGDIDDTNNRKSKNCLQAVTIAYI